MTYLTCARLRHDTLQARDYAREVLEAAHQDAGHRLIWSLFSTDPKAKRSFIFRRSDKNVFMIVSTEKPSYDQQVWDIKTKPYTPDLVEGQRYGFSLRVNPTIGVSQPRRARSLRVDVLMHAKRENGASLTLQEREEVALSWLEGKFRKIGAQMDKDLCLVMDYTQIHLPRKQPNKPAVISAIDVDGALSVTNPLLLQEALKQGIGHGKAFGLGLLLLRPLSVDS